MSEHYCTIGRVKTAPIEGANTLQMAFYNGLPYAVSKDVTEDKLYVIFFPDGQLSEQYAKANDLIERKDPETGKRAGGFFAKNRKVRSIKLMKGSVTSVGFIAGLDTLAFTGYDLSLLKEGDSFSELNGVPICRKYITPATERAQRSGSGQNKSELRGLYMHQNTLQYYKNKEKIEIGDIVTVTEKLDGTSVRCGNAYEKRKLKWYERLLQKLGVKIEEYENKFTTGTRRVIIQEGKDGYYGNNAMYTDAVKDLEGKLSPGEAVYGEIVGWIDENRPLFNRGGVIFKYGCPPGMRKFYVYAWTWTLPNGNTIQLPWHMVKAKAKQFGLETVPEVDFMTDSLRAHYDIEFLNDAIVSTATRTSVLDNSHIKEGYVIRVDKPTGETLFIKYKSPEYYALEDKAKSDENYVDIEEIQDAA